jgi:choice-of-anchor C domain-containing protein
MKRVSALLSMAALSSAAIGAPFTNGSFEGGPATFQFNIPAGSTVIPGWTVSVGNVDWEGLPPFGWQPSNGVNSLDLVGNSGIGGVQQTFDTVPGQTYLVSFDLAGNPGALPVVKPLAVTINGVTQNFTFDTTGKSGSNMGWVTRTLSFTASGASSTINFVSDVTASGGTLNAGAALDNVQITPAAGPSTTLAIPLTWAQLGAAMLLALTGLAFLARRRG